MTLRVVPCCCSDGGMLIMAKAEQQKAKFRWIDMNRYEVSNKVSHISKCLQTSVAKIASSSSGNTGRAH